VEERSGLAVLLTDGGRIAVEIRCREPVSGAADGIKEAALDDALSEALDAVGERCREGAFKALAGAAAGALAPGGCGTRRARAAFEGRPIPAAARLSVTGPPPGPCGNWRRLRGCGGS
jgi:hypothetical protein